MENSIRLRPQGHQALRIFSLLATLLASAPAAEVHVVRHPVTMGTGIELGQIVQGKVQDKDNDINGAFTQRIGIYINQKATINERLAIDIGVGGLFWYAYPIVKNAPWSVSTKFGPGISSAQAVYHFGKPGEAKASLQFGFFPLKYNPDARNLGEYLFRSGVYPAYLWTGGWWTVNNSFYFAQGARFSWNTFGALIKHEFLLLMERDFAPMGDITPSYLLSVNPGGAFEFGAGAALHHFLPMRPSTVSPKDIGNQHITVPRQFIPAGDSVYVRVTAAETRTGDTLKFEKTTPAGRLTVYDYAGPGTQLTSLQQDAIRRNQAGKVIYAADDTYSIQGVKLMARGSLSLTRLIGKEDLLGPGGLRIFAEAAVLGVKDYSFYYEKVKDRMPIMFGLSSPIPKVLDLLSVQFEHYSNPFPNSIENLYQFQLPQPGLRTGAPLDHEDISDDDWKWSVYMSKTVFPNLTLFAQVAQDHMRTIDHDAKLAYEDVLASKGDWYYMMRVEFGI